MAASIAGDPEGAKDEALEGIEGVAPAEDDGADTPAGTDRATPDVREAKDASDTEGLARDPADSDAKLDVELDETFPGSDAPSTTRPGASTEPAPSSGYDPEAEKAR